MIKPKAIKTTPTKGNNKTGILANPNSPLEKVALIPAIPKTNKY